MSGKRLQSVEQLTCIIKDYAGYASVEQLNIASYDPEQRKALLQVFEICPPGLISGILPMFDLWVEAFEENVKQASDQNEREVTKYQQIMRNQISDWEIKHKLVGEENANQALNQIEALMINILSKP